MQAERSKEDKGELDGISATTERARSERRGAVCFRLAFEELDSIQVNLGGEEIKNGWHEHERRCRPALGEMQHRLYSGDTDPGERYRSLK